MPYMEIINEGNHVHIAHTSNRKLKRIVRWGRRHNAGPVHEFQFSQDHLDCVHTTISKHYQTPSDPFGHKTCDDWYAYAKGKKRPQNCAGDFQGPNRIAVLNRCQRDNARMNRIRKVIPFMSQVEIRTAPYESDGDDPRGRC